MRAAWIRMDVKVLTSVETVEFPPGSGDRGVVPSGAATSVGRRPLTPELASGGVDDASGEGVALEGAVVWAGLAGAMRGFAVDVTMKR